MFAVIKIISLLVLLSFVRCDNNVNNKCDIALATESISFGTIDDDSYKSVAIVDTFKTICTGTLISNKTVLTASHCIKKSSIIFFNNILINSYVIHPKYDVALLYFLSGIEIVPSLLNENDFGVGDDIKIIGYGVNAYNNRARRIGYNRISQVTESLIYLSCADGDTACNGDSGGPIIFDDKIIGINHKKYGVCGIKSSATRVDILFDWIKENLK